MKKSNKKVMIVGGVLLLGVIVFSIYQVGGITQKKRNEKKKELKADPRPIMMVNGRMMKIGKDDVPLDPNRECPKPSTKLPFNCTQGMDARSIACRKESKRLGGVRCVAYL